MSKSKKKPSEPETFICVKMPSSSAYPSCPSGDTDYEVAIHEAIASALPSGWQVVKARTGYRPAVDSDGFTLMRVERSPQVEQEP